MRKCTCKMQSKVYITHRIQYRTTLLNFREKIINYYIRTGNQISQAHSFILNLLYIAKEEIKVVVTITLSFSHAVMIFFKEKKKRLNNIIRQESHLGKSNNDVVDECSDVSANGWVILQWSLTVTSLKYSFSYQLCTLHNYAFTYMWLCINK